MEGQAPHPLDLPRLRSEPAAEVLLAALEGLVVPPPSWDRPADVTAEIALASSRGASDSALAHWLTRLVGSDLWWIEDDEAKEQIWSSASKRMAERCGRTGTQLPLFLFILI
jgi:D-xylulose reductase